MATSQCGRVIFVEAITEREHIHPIDWVSHAPEAICGEPDPDWLHIKTRGRGNMAFCA
jgi:hypothetical protein